MSHLHFQLGWGYVNPKYIMTPDKNLLIIWYYAKDPKHSEPRKHLTLKHLGAINKTQLMKEKERSLNLKIHPENLEDRALFLVDLIKCINYHLEEIKTCGLRLLDDSHRNRLVLRGIQRKYPDLKKEQLEEGFKLIEFLETLKGGIYYEKDYLDKLLEKFKDVPDDIKKEYGF